MQYQVIVIHLHTHTQVLATLFAHLVELAQREKLSLSSNHLQTGLVLCIERYLRDDGKKFTGLRRNRNQIIVGIAPCLDLTMQMVLLHQHFHLHCHWSIYVECSINDKVSENSLHYVDSLTCLRAKGAETRRASPQRVVRWWPWTCPRSWTLWSWCYRWARCADFRSVRLN